MPDEKKSVLATMAAEVMAEKKTAARALTPVAGEVGAPLPVTPAAFPNDMPTEVVQQKSGELRRIAGHLIEAADALDALVDAPLPEKVVDLAAKQKEREFAADFNAKQRAAQEAVFSPPADSGETETIDTGGWVCSIHGKAVEKTSPKSGRTFIGCPDCNQFAR